MKIKHWQGYGCVNAKKISDNDNILVVEVKGNHEWGLKRNDKYDVFNWLVKRFTKKCKSYSDIVQILIHEYLVKEEDGQIVDAAKYVIGYHPGE
jgi:hypothetical protein